MKTPSLTAASSALALMAAESGSGSGHPDDLLKSDAAPHPQTASETAPAEPQADPSPTATGLEPGADPSPPSDLKDAETTNVAPPKADEPKADKPKAGKKAKEPEAGSDPLTKRAYMVWAQPGHETLGIGQVIAVPTAQADVLRGAGRARFASEAEVEAAKAARDAGNARVILELDGV